MPDRMYPPTEIHPDVESRLARMRAAGHGAVAQFVLSGDTIIDRFHPTETDLGILESATRDLEAHPYIPEPRTATHD